MAGNYIEIDTGMLENGRNIVSENIAGVRNEMQQLFEEIKQLDAMWEGAAHTAFAQQFQSDYQVLSEVCDNLEVYIDHLSYAGKSYVNCENTVADIIAAISI